ncbi:MAG: Zn-ribbon domain-containing OB-fold protein [Dehalococcoidia bacterium]|nr:Zn-ribbon domain-containing OB-fold protein [Dehalococcoidia bacterium]
MADYEKPLPPITDDTKPFWDGCKRHELLLPKCKACNRIHYYPRMYCPHCMSDDLEWIKASGKGRVYSFTVVHLPPRPAFAPDVPYTVAVIELQEGVHMMSNVVQCPPENVKIGMPVQVVFDDVTEEITLPKFKPV